jgi:hypothetical protein
VYIYESDKQKMQTGKQKAKREFFQNEKRLEKKHYRIIIGLMILSVICYGFLEPKIAGQIIGYDKRYTLFILWGPVISGIIILGVYRRQFLIHKFSTNRGFVLWTFMIFFYLLEGVFVSCLSLGQVARISWVVANKMAEKKNQTELIKCEVTKFWTKRKPFIEFKFQGRYENIKVSYEAIKGYQDENPDQYSIEIETKKGVWNYYIMNSWMIKEKN